MWWDCPDGYIAGDDGLCLEDGPAPDTGEPGSADTAADTGDGDSDSGEAPPYTVCDDGVAPFATLQDAVEAAQDGDTLYLCPGTWQGFRLEDMGLTIVGDDPETTLVFGSTAYAVDLEEAELALSGVTLRSGTSAVFAQDSRLDLSRVRIADNSGTAILVLRQTEFSLADGVVEDNDNGTVFSLTTAEPGSLSITHTVFRRNTDMDDLTSLIGPAVISNNLFVDNTVLATRHVVKLWGMSGGSEIYFTNNTLVGNSSTDQENAYVLSSVGGEIQNNIVVDNPIRQLRKDDNNGQQPNVVQYNDFYGNGESAGTEVSGTGNISADPRFTDAASGDYSLQYGYSSAVDAGNPSSSHNDPDGSRNDMGAYGGPSGAW